MKFTVVLPFLLIFGCADLRPTKTVEGHPLAYDSMAKGRVKATAVKKLIKREVCFDTSLGLQETGLAEALPRNWTLAWIDKKNQYHLLSLNQRDPASVPKGGQLAPKFGARQEWSNTFRTCAPRAKFDDVTGLVLTPRELPFEEVRGLRLNWD